MVNFTILSEEQIKEDLETLPEWQLDSGSLVAEYTFADFRTAFAFMAMVAIEAEKLGHHPEWSNVYNQVRFSISTHDANAITDLDIKLARYIRKTAAQFN